MAISDRKIGFIGAGNMGEAIVGALVRAGIAAPGDIGVSDVNEGRLLHFSETYGVNTLTDNAALFSGSDVVVLAVKPQIMDKVLLEIIAGEGYGPGDRRIVVSIAAGVSIDRMEAQLYANLAEEERSRMPIIRVMPNTPALVLEGMSGMSGNRHALPEDLAVTRQILESMGTVIEFPESDLDAVTAVSGSGPAYVFYLVESMMAAGEKLGLNPADASQLTLKTLRGAVRLMEESDESPAELRRRVTSPGGTTEAAITHLEEHAVRQRIVEALSRAAARSRELS